MRYCTHCKQDHPESDFYRYGGTKPNAGDLRTYCKDAQRIKNTIYKRGRYQRGAAGLLTSL